MLTRSVMSKTWIIIIQHTQIRLSNKQLARELVRATGAQVFWEDDPDAPDGGAIDGTRPIFVGPKPRREKQWWEEGEAWKDEPINDSPVRIPPADILFKVDQIMAAGTTSAALTLLQEWGVLINHAEFCPFGSEPRPSPSPASLVLPENPRNRNPS